MVKDNLWVGYEDPDSLRIKVRIVFMHISGIS